MDKVIEAISKRIVNYYIKKGYIQVNKKEVYQYGIIVAVQSGLITIATLIIGMIFGLFFENLCFFIVFRIIRKFSGGLHSEKFSICFSASIVLNALFLLTYRLFVLAHNFMIIIPIELVSSLVLLLFSPIKNRNKVISKKESRIYKFIVAIICVFVMVLSMVLISNSNIYVYPFCMAALLDAIFVVLGHIRTSSTF